MNVKIRDWLDLTFDERHVVLEYAVWNQQNKVAVAATTTN